MPSSWKSLLKTTLKIAFVVVVFWWLSKKDLISMSAFLGGLKNWPQLLIAFSALALSAILAAFRWGMLLRAQGIVLGNGRLLQLQFIGNFFNIALPGAVSGDFVKAFYIAKESPGNRAKAFGSILFDRLLGLTALAVVSCSALLIQGVDLSEGGALSGVKAFTLTAGAGVLVFYSYLFLVREGSDPLLRIFQALERRNEKFGSLARIYLGIRFYHSEPTLVLKAFIMAFLIQSLTALSLLHFAYALSETGISPEGLFVVAPLGLLVTAVPILPGGVGTGHAAFSFLFHLIGSERGADIFSYFVLNNLALGSIGGLLYLRFKSASPEVAAALEKEASEA